MIKRLILAIVIVVLFSGFNGEWLSRIPEVANVIWQQFISIWTAITSASGYT